MVGKNLVDQKKLAIKKLRCATMYVSEYRNSIAKLVDKPTKKSIASTRSVLCQQLRALIELTESNKYGADEEFVSAAFLICDHYFQYMYSIIKQVWGEVLSESECIDIRTHALYQLSDKHEDQIDEELKRLRENSENETRITVFIIRFLVGRTLYEEAADSLASSDSRGKDKITRSIEFSPEVKQAGISILSYFGTIIDRRYPDSEVTVRIEQQGNTVILIVETPTGEVETIERELDSYGKVITGEQSVDEYSSDPMEVLMIKNKLEITQLELRQTKELLHTERAQYEKRIENLEDNVSFMRSIFDKTQQDAEKARKILGKIALDAQSNIAQTFLELVEILVNFEKSNKMEIEEKIAVIHKEQPSLIDKLNELLIKGSIQGAAGNALWAALIALPKI